MGFADVPRKLFVLETYAYRQCGAFEQLGFSARFTKDCISFVENLPATPDFAADLFRLDY